MINCHHPIEDTVNQMAIGFLGNDTFFAISNHLHGRELNDGDEAALARTLSALEYIKSLDEGHFFPGEPENVPSGYSLVLLEVFRDSELDSQELGEVLLAIRVGDEVPSERLEAARDVFVRVSEMMLARANSRRGCW